jgi:protein-ribulosamine 3-kinase
MSISPKLLKQIENYLGRAFVPNDKRVSGGGCINQALVISDRQSSFFIKLNSQDRHAMFEAEAKGLAELKRADAIRVPSVIGYGNDTAHAWIILERIEFGSYQTGSEQRAGQQLAALHKFYAKQFGLDHNNTIGSTLQTNTHSDSWIEFWKISRLGFQLHQAIDAGYSGKVIDMTARLIDECDKLIDHNPKPSLLHGDLWSGNLSYDLEGNPVIYDPAVYYGDHEADLAMTELFGGFSGRFYSAYRDVFPVDIGYNVRRRLYNLYHILNHMNMFGGGYQSQAATMAESLLAEIR